MHSNLNALRHKVTLLSTLRTPCHKFRTAVPNLALHPHQKRNVNKRGLPHKNVRTLQRYGNDVKQAAFCHSLLCWTWNPLRNWTKGAVQTDKTSYKTYIPYSLKQLCSCHNFRFIAESTSSERFCGQNSFTMFWEPSRQFMVVCLGFFQLDAGAFRDKNWANLGALLSMYRIVLSSNFSRHVCDWLCTAIYLPEQAYTPQCTHHKHGNRTKKRFGAIPEIKIKTLTNGKQIVACGSSKCYSTTQSFFGR